MSTQTTENPQFVPGQIIAGGAAAGAAGVLISWDGADEAPHGALVDSVADLGIDPPAPRTAHARIGAAVDSLRARGFVVRSARGGGRGEDKARWCVGTGRPEGEVGDPFGTLILTVSLRCDGTVNYVTGNEEADALAADVDTEYKRTSADDLFPPGDVTYWLQGVMVKAFGARKLGGSWYVPNEHADRAQELCWRLSAFWGANWMLPAIPVASTEQLCLGLVRSMSAEVEALAQELSQRRGDAKKAGRPDIGPRGCRAFLSRCDALEGRIRSLAPLVGDTMAAGPAVHLGAMRTLLRSLELDGVRRGEAS